MKGLAVKLTNGNTTLYTNTDHVFVGGTNHLCLRTGNATTDVVSYPLTTNTSASQYSPIRIKINGSNCYLASQSQGYGVAYTLPQATILGYTPGNLLLNTYSEYYFVSNSVSRYSETNSIRQGTLIGQEIVEWPGKYTTAEGEGQGALIDIIDNYTQSKFHSYELPTNDDTVFAGFATTSTSSSTIPPFEIMEKWWEEYYLTYLDYPAYEGQEIATYKGGNGGYTYFTLNEFSKQDYYKRDPSIYQNLQSGTTTMTVTSNYLSTFTSAPLAYNDLYTYYSETTAIGKRYGRDLAPCFINNFNGEMQVYWERFIYNDTKSLYLTTNISGHFMVLTISQRNGGAIPTLNYPTAQDLNNQDIRGFYYSKNQNVYRNLGFRTVISITGTYTHLRPEISDHQYSDSREILETITLIHNSIGYFFEQGFYEARLKRIFESYTCVNNNGNYKYPNIRGLSTQLSNFDKLEKIFPEDYSVSRRVSVNKNSIVVSTYYGKNLEGVGIPLYEHWLYTSGEEPVEDYEYDEYEGGKEYFATYTEGIYDEAEIYYVPYSYTRYSQYVNKNVPIYDISYHYNYSTTTKYSLQVPGLANYTSSLPYNTSNVYSEEYGPVLDRQQNVYVITKTSVGYGYDYSTNVLPPYLATIYNQAIEQGDYINVRTTSEYTDQYTNAALCPSGKTFVGSHTEPENKVVQELRQVAAATAPSGTHVGPYYKTIRKYYADSVYDTGPTTLEGAEPSAITNLNEYTKATRLGNYYAGSVSSYKSTYGYKAINGVNVNTGYVMTATKNKYYNYEQQATVVYDLDTYFSTAIKQATDTNLGYYDQVVDPNKTAVYWNGYGNPKASDTVNWESSKTSKDPVWEKVGNDTAANGRYDSKSSATDTAFYGTKSASDSYADMASKFFGATWSQLNKKGFASNSSTWTEYRTTTNDSSTAYKDSIWPGQTFSSYSTSRTTSFSAYVFYKYVKAKSYTGKARRSSTQSTQTYSVRRISSQRLYVSGHKTRYINRSSFRSGAKKNTYNYTSSYNYDLSSRSFTDAYQYYENVNTVITHTIVTLAELSQIRSSNTKYTLKTSRVDKDYKYSYLYTYTTSHKYYTSNITNNVNV